MSQVTKFISNSGGGGYIQTLTGNTGGAVPPTAGNINVVGDGFSIDVSGNPGSSTLVITQTGADTGAGTTVGAVTADLITIALGIIPAVVSLEVRIASIEATTPAGAGYLLFSTIRTDGASATLVGTVDRIINEELALVTADATIVVSGNNAIVRVTGVAGLTINWVANSIQTVGV